MDARNLAQDNDWVFWEKSIGKKLINKRDATAATTTKIDRARCGGGEEMIRGRTVEI